MKKGLIGLLLGFVLTTSLDVFAAVTMLTLGGIIGFMLGAYAFGFR